MKSNGRDNNWKLLFENLEHTDFLVRGETARLLGQLKDRRSVPNLINLLKNDRWYTKVTAVYALDNIQDKRAIPVLEKISKDPGVFAFTGMYNYNMIRISAALALLKFNNKKGIKNIKDVIKDNTQEVFIHMASTILAMPNILAMKPLKKLISFKYLDKVGGKFSSNIHARIAQALGYKNSELARTKIQKYLSDFSPYVRIQAAKSLIRQSNSSVTKSRLRKMYLKEKSPFAVVSLAGILYEIDPAKYGRRIVASLRNSDYFVRATCLDIMAACNMTTSVKSFLPLLKDEHFYVRLCAIDALEKLGGNQFVKEIRSSLKDSHPRVKVQAAKSLIAVGD